MVKESNIIHISPKELLYWSPVSLSPSERIESAKNQGYQFDEDNFRLSGDWDLNGIPIYSDHPTRPEYQHYLKYKKGIGRKEYRPDGFDEPWDWEVLSRLMKKDGYVQAQGQLYVEVAIGRNGKYLLTDGIHRTITAKELGIKSIPVKVVYIHPDYNFGNLDSIHDDLIPEVIYDLIIKKWDKNTTLYQTYEWNWHRFEMMRPFIHLMKDRKVLDLGCNAFMSAWSILKYAESLIGVEQTDQFYQQGVVTMDCLHSLGECCSREIWRLSIEDYATRFTPGDFDFLFGYCIMYWLDKEGVEILRTKLLPHADRIFMSTRRTDNPSYRNDFKFNDGRNLKKFFEKEGYTVQLRQTNIMNLVVGERL